MIYAHLENKTNKLLGWYDDSIHSEIPTPNIEVTKEVWQEALNINANCYENGEFIVKDFRTQEEIETRRINDINLKASKIITGKYPLYKQNNITLLLTPYTKTDKEEMSMFIDTVRNIAKNAKNNGIFEQDIDWADLDK